MEDPRYVSAGYVSGMSFLYANQMHNAPCRDALADMKVARCYLYSVRRRLLEQPWGCLREKGLWFPALFMQTYQTQKTSR